MDITIITRSYYPNNSTISQKISAVIGSFDHVRGWNVAHVLRHGESKIIWLSAFLSIIVPITWPVRVTNVGAGVYRVSRPFPWIFGAGADVREAVKPATVESRLKLEAVVD